MSRKKNRYACSPGLGYTPFMANLPVFVGFDWREADAFEVLKKSIDRHSSVDVDIIPLEHRLLRQTGWFKRPWKIEPGGQFIDLEDGKPFSTEFSHSRFLTPALARGMGYSGFCLFMDCDFMFRRDVVDLFELSDPEAAVQVVKRKWAEPEGKKMDGMAQCNYPRKLWSSLMLFNLDHPDNVLLTPDEVNTAQGAWMHALGWLDNYAIGSLPAEWNYIPGVDKGGQAAAVHFSLGIPRMDGYKDSEFAQEWFSYRESK